MDTVIQQELDLFFEDPKIYIEPPRKYSVLYLLRRDIDTALGFHRDRAEQYGIDGTFDPQNPIYEIKSLFLAISGVLTGIDLLAKFYAGSDITGVGERFRSFYKKYFSQDVVDAPVVMYDFRNSIIHSYGVHGHKYKFELTGKEGQVINIISEGVYQIYGMSLFLAFEHSLHSYHIDVQNNSDLQDKFHRMFPKYGTTTMNIIPLN